VFGSLNDLSFGMLLGVRLQRKWWFIFAFGKMKAMVPIFNRKVIDCLWL